MEFQSLNLNAGEGGVGFNATLSDSLKVMFLLKVNCPKRVKFQNAPTIFPYGSCRSDCFPVRKFR